jgi:hypothetical protein
VEQGSCGGVNGVVDLATFLVGQPGSLDECRSAFQVLLEKHWGIDSTRPALENRRTVFEEGHDARTHREVVTKQLKLRDLFVRPIDALEAGERNALAIDCQRQICFGIF